MKDVEVQFDLTGAKAGIDDAQYNLGCRYALGQGVKRSKRKALKWLKRAAKQGFKDAVDAVADIKKHGLGGLVIIDRMPEGKK